MTNKPLDLESLRKDISEILHKHGLVPENYGISLELDRDAFDKISIGHPDLILPELILKTDRDNSGAGYFIQIRRKLEITNLNPDNEILN
jgi:hypothetical protein